MTGRTGGHCHHEARRQWSGWHHQDEIQDEVETGAVLTPRFKLWNFNVLLNFILVCGGVQAAQTGLEVQEEKGFESSWPGPWRCRVRTVDNE